MLSFWSCLCDVNLEFFIFCVFLVFLVCWVFIVFILVSLLLGCCGFLLVVCLLLV